MNIPDWLKWSRNKDYDPNAREEINFGSGELNNRPASNKTRTSKYTWLSWAPLSLLLQFTRAANIYFLIISILTAMPFSPKSPGSMIGTFAAVLIFTMFKELFEDYFRMKSDREVNNSTWLVLNHETGRLETRTWKDIKTGDILRINKDETFPWDMLFIYSKDEVIFVDTMNLDGETNLKPKTISSIPLQKEIKGDIHSMSEADIADFQHKGNNNEDDQDKYNKNLTKIAIGKIDCEQPSENLEKWDGKVTIDTTLKGEDSNFYCSIDNLLLRGCYLRNIKYVYGIAVYLGKESKIMMNAKKPPRKVSNLMKLMNYMLYTVFGLQLLIITIYASCSIGWIATDGEDYDYLDLDSDDAGVGKWIIQLLTFWVAYSHMIPISLYVMIEVLKLTQATLIKWDKDISEEDDFKGGKSAECKNSDLIEELGQVDMIFSDKTGTLTWNQMIFRKCSVGGQVYNDPPPEDHDASYNSRSGLNGDNYEKNWRDEVQDGNSSELIDFFKHMTICHSVMVEKPSQDNEEAKEDNESQKTQGDAEPNYQWASPDEIALVKAAGLVGYRLTGRSKDYITVTENNTLEKYRMCLEFEFDSTRKRMSVVSEKNGEYYLYTKGADNKMLPIIKFNNKEEKETLDKHLYDFAIEGLRTLVMGKRKLTKEQYREIESYIDKWRAAGPDKEKMLAEVYEKYEADLEFVGASAIEDKLQDKVPDTISMLMKANIRVWVLTGDKQETAVEIAKSCKLIQEGFEVKFLTIQNKEPNYENLNDREAEEEKNKYITKWKDMLDRDLSTILNDILKEKDELDPNTILKTDFRELNLKKPMTIVIDGPTLAFILGDEKLEMDFLRVGIFSNSVVCCRVSPKQKSLVVKLANYKKGWIKLAIGDGANDVPMIMEANIGVGIRGKEGTQAVRSADYAISQFKFLQKLMLFHGRLGYRRVSWVVWYYFYKNIVLVFTELYFAWSNGFSGQIYFADWLPMLYNALWTSLTCLFAYALEKDVDYKTTLSNPQLYSPGQKREYFSYLKFWKWVILAAFHGVIVYFGCSYGFRGIISSDGKTEDMWFASTTAFSWIIHLVTVKLALELVFMNWIVILAGILSVLFYWIFVIILNTSVFAQLFQPEIESVYFRMFANGKFWLALIFIPLIATIPDMTINYFRMMYFPSTSDKVLQSK